MNITLPDNYQTLDCLQDLYEELKYLLMAVDDPCVRSSFYLLACAIHSINPQSDVIPKIDCILSDYICPIPGNLEGKVGQDFPDSAR